MCIRDRTMVCVYCAGDWFEGNRYHYFAPESQYPEDSDKAPCFTNKWNASQKKSKYARTDPKMKYVFEHHMKVSEQKMQLMRDRDPQAYKLLPSFSELREAMDNTDVWRASDWSPPLNHMLGVYMLYGCPCRRDILFRKQPKVEQYCAKHDVRKPFMIPTKPGSWLYYHRKQSTTYKLSLIHI